MIASDRERIDNSRISSRPAESTPAPFLSEPREAKTPNGELLMLGPQGGAVYSG